MSDSIRTDNSSLGVRAEGPDVFPPAAGARRAISSLSALVFAAPLLYFWGGMVWEGGVKVALGTTGQLAPAEIMHQSYSYTRTRQPSGVRVSDIYRCSYVVAGKTYTLSTSRSRTRPHDGAPSAAYFAFAPAWHAQIVFPGESLAQDGGGELFMAALLGLFFGFFFWLVFNGYRSSNRPSAAKAR